MYKQINSVKRLITGILLIGFSTVAFSSKVAIVDINKVLEKSPQRKQLVDRLEKEFAPKRKAIQTMRDNLRKMEARMSKDGVTMSREKLRQLEIKIRKERRKIARKRVDVRDDYTVRLSDERNKLIEKVKKAVAAVAKKGKYTMVLSRDIVIYYDDTVNITDQVTAAMK